MVMDQAIVVTSPLSRPGATQAGLVYLCTALTRRGAAWELIDLGGTVEFYRAPEALHQRCDSPGWMDPESIRQADWLDDYLPAADLPSGDVALFSAQFSPDLVFHARHSHLLRRERPDAVTAIGGAALTGLRDDQLRLLAEFFDYVLVGYDVDRLLAEVFDGDGPANGHGRIARAMDPPRFRPDYSLVPLEDFVSVYTGHGCYYAGCHFCDFPARADRQVSYREPAQVAREIGEIFRLAPAVGEVFLTQDSYPREYLQRTTREIERQCGSVPFSLMLRAEPWVGEDLGESLARSGCVDAFIGAEGLDDEILAQLNKGLTTQDIVDAVRAVGRFVDVTLGMIVFVPGISERAREAQLRRLEAILPYISRIELEILTVVNGSEFAQHPSRYGIVPWATERVVNDSWCFGLSQDIPWTMADPGELTRWLEHAKRLKALCGDLVPPIYWESINRLASDLGHDRIA